MLTGPEEIFFFSRAKKKKKKTQDEMFIENSMKRSRAGGVETASSNTRLESCFRADPQTVKTSRYSLEEGGGGRKKEMSKIYL